MHGGVSSSNDGLDRLFKLLKADEITEAEWREPFEEAVVSFEKAVAAMVEDDAVVEAYKTDALLASEALTQLRFAERNDHEYR
jgi:hypothetical protein